MSARLEGLDDLDTLVDLDPDVIQALDGIQGLDGIDRAPRAGRDALVGAPHLAVDPVNDITTNEQQRLRPGEPPSRAESPVSSRRGPRPQAAQPAHASGARRASPEPVPDVAGARPGRESRRQPDRGLADQGHPDQAVDRREPVDSDDGTGVGSRPTCTAAQLRRFIKSRVYIPMHELRRRFAINGHDDDVCAVEVDSHRIYVGLPPAEGRLLGELLRNGEVGYELSMDPETPVVVGVYSMRPVSRS